MKVKNLFKVAFIALFALAMMQSCSKDEEQVITTDDDSWSVRPDFATLDTRPTDVIMQYQVTDDHAVPAELTRLKTAGKYALVIGISDYSGTSNDLTYCDDDAEDWKNRLQAEGYSVTILKDLNATKSAIEDAVEDLASLSVAGNEIAFCYSGHGSSGNIISSDLYYIGASWFKTTFSSATSTKMMFSFDACQIGAMKKLRATGRVVAVASNRSLYSYDGTSAMANGVYTYYQMKGFDDLGYIYFETDCDYANDEMEDWASSVGVNVAPSYSDNYSGNLDL